MNTLPVVKATNVTSFRKNLKRQLDTVVNESVSLIVTRNDDQNVVVLSEKEYEKLIKDINNLNYELMLMRSYQQATNGQFITKTLDELKDYEK